MLKSTNKLEANKYELEIQVSAEVFEEAVQKAYLKNKSKISVPGFRVGKAPRKLIEKEYGEACFYDDAVNDLYPIVVEEAVNEAGLELVTRPEVEVTEVGKEKGVTYKVTCVTKPEVEIENYKGIEVTKTVYTVTDADIDAEIENIRHKGMRIVGVDDRAAQLDDEVLIDFEGFLDGVPFEGGKGEKFPLTLGSGQFIPGFEEQVVGHNIDEEFDINVTFPEEYQAAELAGKPVVFKIKIHEIKAKELPDVDDEFVKDTTEFNTVDELKADLKAKLEVANEKRADNEVETKILDTVIDNLKAEIPAVMFENRTNEMVEEFSQRIASQGMTLDLYMQYTGMTIESLKKSYEEQAEKQVKLRLALEKIAKIENIVPTEEDIEAEFAAIAAQYNMKVEEVKKYIRAEDLKTDVAVGKAAELVKSSAVVK